VTWAQNLYLLHRGTMGGILPSAVAGLTKGQMAVITNQGAVAFGPDAEPPPPLADKRPGRKHPDLRTALSTE
jgi:hypothetical protein